jgi:hypothetical protein
MANVNPGPASTSTVSSLATLTPVNALSTTVPGQAGNSYRLLGVARGVNLASTGDAALMPIINASSWSPALIVTSNGQVSGVAGSIATAQIGVFTAAAAGGTVIKTAAALTNNSAANSAIALACAGAAVVLGFTQQSLYVNVNSALANATVDVFLYGYDIS